jgi:D-arabinose 1-dehydrogenase-like Zn-dependent alcohol dehydrogenase
VPLSIAPEKAASLLGSGIIAYNALKTTNPGETIGIVGTNHLAFLTTQFATKCFGLKVTLFGYEGNNEVAA